MAFITRVERADMHTCDLPAIGTLDVGTVWQCSCGRQWGIKWCQGAGFYRAWRGMKNGRFLPFWSADRLPPARRVALV